MKPNTPNKTAVAKPKFNNDFLGKMKKMLLEEKATLEKELTKLVKNPGTEENADTAFPNYGDSEDENAAEVADYIVNLSVGDNMERSLRDVNSALQRLKHETYGICKYCSKPIEEKRLLARPTSSSCMGCKKAITQEI